VIKLYLFCHFSVEKTVEKIECACQFTNRLLEHGDATEILSLRRVVTNQLLDLLKNMPKPNITFLIEFQTDYNNFEKIIGVRTLIILIHICIKENKIYL
jgi:hypothetical protein